MGGPGVAEPNGTDDTLSVTIVNYKHEHTGLVVSHKKDN